MAQTITRSVSYGGWLMVATSLIGFLLSIFNYFWTENGIHHTPGALLVVASTGLLLAASLVIVLDHDKAVWLRGFLYVSTLLDFLGTGLAAWFLEAYWLLALMIIGLIGWLIHLTIDPSDEDLAAIAIRREVLS